MAAGDDATKYIKVKVPEGFLPQSIPVKPDERISSDNVHLKVITKDDLVPIVCLALFAQLLASTLACGVMHIL